MALVDGLPPDAAYTRPDTHTWTRENELLAVIAEGVTGSQIMHPGRPLPPRETTSDPAAITRFFGGSTP